jgi:sugar-specific transcriptional regulator TrmB
LGEETLKTVLKEFGLTDTEVQVYLCVSKQAPINGTDTAHLIKKDKAQVFRILKNLQAKGFIEATLEIPMRFTPVAFEKVLELTIKEKKQQAERIEETKEQLLNYWKSLNKKDLDSSLEKFVVIEGRHKVYSKIAQMITEASIQISVISTVSGLLRAEQFGIFSNIKSKQSVKFRLITEFSTQNLTNIKRLLKSIIKKEINFIVKNPDLGFNVFPRMVIKDNREAVFFITPRNSLQMGEDNLCIWTNCKDLVESFSRVYEDLWQNASAIQDKIQELKAIKQTRKCIPTDQTNKIQIKYQNALQSAKTEILAITSTEGLDEFAETLLDPKKASKNSISIKIMAPITNQNLRTAQQLSKYCQIKHITTSYQKTTLIDQQHLFQFTTASPNTESKDNLPELFKKNVSYTDNPQQIQKTKNILDKLWQSSQTPSFITLESILNASVNPSEELPSQDGLNGVKKINALKISDEQPEMEKDIINRIINAKRIPVKDPTKDLTRVYGFNGQAVIHPPQIFHLPDIMIHAFHNDKQSAYGIEDYMVIYLWLQTSKGPTFVPVTIVGDVKKGEKGLKAVWQGTPAAQNIKIVKKTQLHIQMHANMFFVGWTIPIPLMNPQNTLPPAAVTLEAVGKLDTKTFTVNMPNGYKVKLERNGYSAYVTFLHPKSKYQGPGTDGYINRDLIMTTTPPAYKDNSTTINP